jgi:hypothetical protein
MTNQHIREVRSTLARLKRRGDLPETPSTEDGELNAVLGLRLAEAMAWSDADVESLHSRLGPDDFVNQEDAERLARKIVARSVAPTPATE